MVVAKASPSLDPTADKTEIPVLRDARNRGEEEEETEPEPEPEALVVVVTATTTTTTAVVQGTRQKQQASQGYEQEQAAKVSGGEEATAGTEVDLLDNVRVCYDATGTLAQSFWACDPTAAVSSCCPAGYACVGRGDGDGGEDDDTDAAAALCILAAAGASDPDNDNLTTNLLLSAPRACTDQQWDGHVCGRKEAQCSDRGHLIACGSSSNAGACDCAIRRGGDAGAAHEQPFSAPPSMPDELRKRRASEITPTVVAHAAKRTDKLSSFIIDSTLTITFPSPTRSSSSSPSTTPSTSDTMTTTTSPQSSSSATDSGGLTGIETVVPTVVPIPPGSAGSSSNNNNNANSALGVRLALGIGIPFVIALIITLIFCLHRHMRRRQRKEWEKYPPFDHDAPERKPVNVADFPRRFPPCPPPPPRPPRSDELDLEAAAADVAGARPGPSSRGNVGIKPKVPLKNSSHISQLPQGRWSWRRRSKGMKVKDQEKAKEKAKEEAQEKERQKAAATIWREEKRAAEKRAAERRKRQKRRAEEERAQAQAQARARERLRQQRQQQRQKSIQNGKKKAARPPVMPVRDVQIHQAVAYQVPSGPPTVPVPTPAVAPGSPPFSRGDDSEQRPLGAAAAAAAMADPRDWPLRSPPATATTRNQPASRRMERERESLRRVSKYFSPQHLYRQWEQHHHQQQQQQQQQQQEQQQQQQQRQGPSYRQQQQQEEEEEDGADDEDEDDETALPIQRPQATQVWVDPIHSPLSPPPVRTVHVRRHPSRLTVDTTNTGRQRSGMLVARDEISPLSDDGSAPPRRGRASAVSAMGQYLDV